MTPRKKTRITGTVNHRVARRDVAQHEAAIIWQRASDWMREPVTPLMVRVLSIAAWAYSPHIALSALPAEIRFARCEDEVPAADMADRLKWLGVPDAKAEQIAKPPREFWMKGLPRMTREEFAAMKKREDAT